MKANPKPWLYGPNWQGQRCEARTRRGTPCKRPASPWGATESQML